MIMNQESIINRKHGIIDNVPGPGDRNLGRDLVLELGWNWAGMRNKACGWASVPAAAATRALPTVIHSH